MARVGLADGVDGEGADGGNGSVICGVGGKGGHGGGWEETGGMREGGWLREAGGESNRASAGSVCRWQPAKAHTPDRRPTLPLPAMHPQLSDKKIGLSVCNYQSPPLTSSSLQRLH